MLDIQDVRRWEGADLVDRDGDKIGSIDEIYVDDDTNAPEFALVKTGFLGTGSHFVPLKDAQLEGDTLRVPYEKERVKDAPGVDADGHLSQQEERALYDYYGLGYSEHRSDSGLPEGGTGLGADRGTDGRDTSGPTTDEAMTRSEEELRVGTRESGGERVRLRKFVTTENVTQTVPVRKENVRVEREPITEANRGAALEGPDISEEEHEVVLTQEEPVVETRAVPKERVRLEKDVTTEERQVSGDVRKEHIEVEDPAQKPQRD